MSAAAGAGGASDGAVRSFSGENEDGREYKRWKVWVTNKLLTLDTKVPAKARGAYVYTLLSGKALECVEHLDPSDYQVENGEDKLFALLDERFPQKEASDEMSEVLTEVFNLKALEGETLKVWISRATEMFDRCKRKCQVSFPEEAKGWLILHRSGLNDEQKAVIMARSGGVMKRETIGKAMRSCYPEYVVSKRKTMGVAVVDPDEPPPEDFEQDPVFQEVESFLAEHELAVPAEEPDEIYEEHEVAEALAVTWKEKRKELTKMQKNRRFSASSDLKKAYRVEIEELKKRTRCHKCQQVGHWSRECKSASKGKGRSGAPTAKSSDSGAAMVEASTDHFVAAVTMEEMPLSTLDILRQRQQQNVKAPVIPEVLLVSSPGYGVIDSGCGRTIVGCNTLEDFKQLWIARGIAVPEPFHEVNHFKFGNGQRETSEISMRLPVYIAGRRGTIKAAVVKGNAPLLISRGALQTLRAIVDFGENQMKIFEDQAVVPLHTNAAGQYVISVMDDVKVDSGETFQEVMLGQSDRSWTEVRPSAVLPSEPLISTSATESIDQIPPPAEESNEPGLPSDLQVWVRHDSLIDKALTSGKQGPAWQSVKRRRVLNGTTGEVLFDEHVTPTKAKKRYHQKIPAEVMHVTTEFYFTPQEKTITAECLPVHCVRQFEAQVRKPVSRPTSHVDGKPFLVAEVFGPPRFAPLIDGIGGVCKSFDLTTGFDFTQASVRDAVAEDLRVNPPDLLILCPPCTDEGGWFHLNSLTMDPQEYIRRVRQSRMFIRFCCKLYQQQVDAGGQALLEHPHGSQLWGYDEVRKLAETHHVLKCHMCRFGLRVPGNDQFIRKATKLLVSHENMKVLAKECPGKSHPQHACHQPIAGSDSKIGRISTFAGKYTPMFVESVMDTVPRYCELKKQSLVPCPEWPAHAVQEVLAAKPDLSDTQSDEDLLKVIDKVHRNLGHPPNHDLIRIFKHAGASERAIELAKKHSCEFCKAQVRPHVPLPAKSSRPHVFNQCLGIDVKFLPGWKANQQVKALNLVDQASCYQLMIPFHERETSAVLKKLIAEHWVRTFGPPKEVVIDQARTNLGDHLQSYLDSLGCHVHQIAGEAHWQLGRTESHGGWFARVLAKTLAEFPPAGREEWESCVVHSHVKNTMIQSYGYTPHQHVFGKNPEIPSDLMNEPLHVVPATASLTDEAIAKSQAIRTAARKSVIETQDDLALRRAFSARPRMVQQFQPGDLVAYWRCQKYQQGQVIQGGNWYGTAVVIGNVGKNYVIAHRKQIFRAAPEQLRAATNEEKAMVTTPNTELLGIRDMIEGGTFRSHQFVDLVPGHYPTMEEPPPVVNNQSEPQVSNDPAGALNVPESPAPIAPDVPVPVDKSPESEVSPGDESQLKESSSPHHESSNAQSASSTYGPLRRVRSKNGPPSLYRPPAMQADDFAEMMKEIVPQLVEEATKDTDASMHAKRPLESTDAVEEPSSHRQKTEQYSEVMSVEDVNHLSELFADPSTPIEVLIANYMQKKTSKEVPPMNNPPEMQSLVDESKQTEWSTILEKGAVRVHYGRRAAEIRSKYSDRFIGSRFVIVKKAVEENKSVDDSDPSSFRVKSRWCLQGHLDPDLNKKVEAGLLQSPTLSQMGRMLTMQLIASNGWMLQLGDIKGAFLEAGPLPSQFRPLYAHQPRGGIPGVPSDAVLEVVGNLYGQNDAPLAWHKTFDSEAIKAGWERSRFDPCLYFLRCNVSNRLCGVMGVHVDDTAVGGAGENFNKAIEVLRARFPYRKWRVGEGEFCGAFYTQCSTTKEITMSQKLFAEKLRPANIPRSAKSDDPLAPGQISVLRAINGSLNWLASQSRPDLSVQTSLSQQAFPQPKIQHLREANQAVRRARQHKDLQIKFSSIPVSELCVCCHSDAAFANVGTHTQAGYIVGFSQTKLHHGEVAHWTPIVWRSYKMPRAVFHFER